MPHAILNCLYSPDTTLEVAVDILAARAVELVAQWRGPAGAVGSRSNARALPDSHGHGYRRSAHGADQGRRARRSGPRRRSGRLPRDSSRCRAAGHGRRRGVSMAGAGNGARPQSEKGEENLLHALELGLAKVMSKMGISVVDSYRGAHLFDAIGLVAAVVDKCFPGVPAPIGGFGFDAD